VVKIIKVEEWMSKPVKTVSKSTTLRQIVKMMDDLNIGVVPVAEGDKPIGIITERDVIRRVVAKNLDLDNTTAGDIMTKNPKTIPHDSTLLEVTRIMSENNFRRLLVVKGSKLVGLVTAKDVIQVMST